MSDNESDVVLHERVGAVAHLVLNRPDKLNAADYEVQERLVDELRAAGNDDEVRAIVVSGSGRALSSGGDRDVLSRVLQGDDDEQFRSGLFALTRDLLRLMLDEIHQPLVVAVSGLAVGWGAGLVALGDFVVMDDDAYLQDPHALYGLGAAPGCELVWSRFVPPAVLKEILLLGRRVSADEAHRWGMVNWLVPSGTATDVARSVAARLTEIPPEGATAIKRGVNREVVSMLDGEPIAAWEHWHSD